MCLELGVTFRIVALFYFIFFLSCYVFSLSWDNFVFGCLQSFSSIFFNNCTVEVMLYVAIPKIIALFLLRVHPKVFAVIILFSFFLLFLPELCTRNIPLILNVNQIHLLGRVCFAFVLSFSYEKFLYLSRSLNSTFFFFLKL